MGEGIHKRNCFCTIMQRCTSHNPATCWILWVCHVCIHCMKQGGQKKGSRVWFLSTSLIQFVILSKSGKWCQVGITGFPTSQKCCLAELIYAYEALKLFLRSQCSSMKRNFPQVPEVLGSRGTEAINQCSYRVRTQCLSERQAYTKVKKLFIPAVIGNFCI